MSYTASANPAGNAAPPPTQAPKGGKGASTLQKTPTVQAPQYDLSQVASDWTNFRNIRQQFDQDTILTGDQLYRQRDPTTPYLFVPAEDGTTNLAKQVVDPTYTFLVDKCKAYNMSGGISVRCPAETNSASPRNLELCEDTIRFTFRWNEYMAPRHFSQSIIHDDILQLGTVACSVWYDTALSGLGGYPIKLCLDNPLAVAYEDDADGGLRRVITAYRVLVGELPQPWRTGDLATKADTDEVTLFKDYNRVNFAAVVDGNVIAQYAHGFVDLMGNPMVPYVIELHDAMKTRLGDAQPQIGYSNPREIRIGRPPFMGLIGTIKHKSFYLTAERYDIRENLAAWEFISGDLEMDYNAKRAIDKTGAGKFSFVAPANILMDIEKGLDRTSAEIEAGGGAGAWMSGQPVTMSGVAQQGQTQIPKQFFEAPRHTHERFLVRVGMMILAMVKSNTGTSMARKFKASTGKDLQPLGSRDYSPDFSNANAMPYYWYVTGDVRVPVDTLTVDGVTDVVVGISPVDSLPKDQAIQLFMNVEQMERQSGRLVVPASYKYGELLGVTNPQGFMGQLALDQFESDPNSPAGKVRLLREVARQRMADENGDPNFWQNALRQLDQQSEAAYQQQWQQQLAALTQPPQMQQGGGGQPPGPPQPQAGPPGAAPQSPAPPPAAPPAVQPQPTPIMPGAMQHPPVPQPPPQPQGGPIPPFGQGGCLPTMPQRIQGVA